MKRLMLICRQVINVSEIISNNYYYYRTFQNDIARKIKLVLIFYIKQVYFHISFSS